MPMDEHLDRVLSGAWDEEQREAADALEAERDEFEEWLWERAERIATRLWMHGHQLDTREDAKHIAFDILKKASQRAAREPRLVRR